MTRSIFLRQQSTATKCLCAALILAVALPAVASDKPIAKPKSPRTVLVEAESLKPANEWRPPLRLATGASARGWLGRMPPKRIRKKTVSAMPPAAPISEPTDISQFPKPAPPLSIRRSPLSMLADETASLNNFAEPLLLKPASGSKSGVKVKRISQSVAQPQETTEEPVTETLPAIELPPTDKTGNASAILDDFLYTRPLAAVSLSSSIAATTLTGAELKQPTDLAGEVFRSYGVYHELPAVHLSRAYCRNQYPISFNPLYFEDPNLERCGVGCGCMTDLVSAVRFFGRVPVVPYMIGANPPCTCVRSLGDCPACHTFGCGAYVPPLDSHGTALQAAATVGLIFLLP